MSGLIGWALFIVGGFVFGCVIIEVLVRLIG